MMILQTATIEAVSAVSAELSALKRCANGRLPVQQQRHLNEAVCGDAPTDARQVRRMEWKGRDVIASTAADGQAQLLTSPTSSAQDAEECRDFPRADARLEPWYYWPQCLSA